MTQSSFSKFEFELYKENTENKKIFLSEMLKSPQIYLAISIIESQLGDNILMISNTCLYSLHNTHWIIFML